MVIDDGKVPDVTREMPGSRGLCYNIGSSPND